MGLEDWRENLQYICQFYCLCFNNDVLAGLVDYVFNYTDVKMFNDFLIEE